MRKRADDLMNAYLANMTRSKEGERAGFRPEEMMNNDISHFIRKGEGSILTTKISGQRVQISQ